MLATHEATHRGAPSGVHAVRPLGPLPLAPMLWPEDGAGGMLRSRSPSPLQPPQFRGGARPLPAMELDATDDAKPTGGKSKGTSDVDTADMTQEVQQAPARKATNGAPPPDSFSWPKPGFADNFVYAAPAPVTATTGPARGFSVSNTPPFTMSGFFRPPWIYPTMAWIMLAYLWAPKLELALYK